MHFQIDKKYGRTLSWAFLYRRQQSKSITFSIYISFDSYLPFWRFSFFHILTIDIQLLGSLLHITLNLMILLYRVRGKFRITRWDGNFWVIFGHFWSELYFWGKWGNSNNNFKIKNKSSCSHGNITIRDSIWKHLQTSSTVTT